MKKKHIFQGMVAVLATAAIIACGNDIDYGQQYNPLIDGREKTNPDSPDPEQNYREPYRPQVHYTPARNWTNDPNGLVMLDGTYHLFYQYNPQGNAWGNMSWGHATSSDLIHWDEQPVALTRDELGAVFSGSCVIDKDNTAGFGANAMVALYTSAGDDGRQQQSLAYSTDGGKTFSRYSGNPVIRNDDDNLRDPKVFWHEQSRQWVMALAPSSCRSGAAVQASSGSVPTSCRWATSGCSWSASTLAVPYSVPAPCISWVSLTAVSSGPTRSTIRSGSTTAWTTMPA